MDNDLEESLLQGSEHEVAHNGGGQTWGSESVRTAEELKVEAAEVSVKVEVPRVKGRTVQVSDLEEGGELDKALEQQQESDGKHQCSVRVNAALDMESESKCLLGVMRIEGGEWR